MPRSSSWFSIQRACNAVGALVLLAGAAGCPDPDKSLDEFSNHVVDAGVVVRVDAMPLDMVPDVTGTFLVALRPGFLQSVYIEFLGEAVLTQNGDGTATLDLTLQGLGTTFQPPTDSDRMPVGAPVTVTGIPVSTSGTFTVMFNDSTIDGLANPLSGSDIVADVNLTGTIRSVDRFCGTADGMVSQPAAIDLANSTWSAIRVPPGTVGADLPPVEEECPAIGGPDAGPGGADAAAPAIDAAAAIDAMP